MFRRFYHVTYYNYSIKKQGIKLNKLINPKSKRQWYPTQVFEENALPSIKHLTKTQNEPGKRGIRRLAMLNNMFMKYITDLMSTGTTSMEVVGRGIEISKVNITPDYQTINVFWVCKSNASDEETEEALKRIAGPLRHELSTLRVMGQVPYITFIKDRQESKITDLDRRLSMADYGEDYTPTEMGHLLKTEFTLDTKLSPEMKTKIKQLEEEIPFIEESIPEMTNNVFGLDHEKIMNRLLAARKKSKEAWSNLDTDPAVISYRAPDEKTEKCNVQSQKEELAEFLLKRQILQKKLQKNVSYTSEEWQQHVEQDCDDYDDDSVDEEYEEDFYEDEINTFKMDNNKKK